MYQVKKAKAGRGLFATREFRSSDRIVEYKGERVALAQTRDGAKYLMELDEHRVIDGRRRDNVARYINHSCKPNAEAIIEDELVFIYARRVIRIGQEITLDYGRDYWEAYIAPKGCRCLPCSPDSRLHGREIG